MKILASSFKHCFLKVPLSTIPWPEAEFPCRSLTHYILDNNELEVFACR